MCKESMAGLECDCGQRVYYREQHLPHCKARVDGQLKVKVDAKVNEPVRVVIEGPIDKVRDIALRMQEEKMVTTVGKRQAKK